MVHRPRKRASALTAAAAALMMAAVTSATACSAGSGRTDSDVDTSAFVSVGADGEFHRGDSVYKVRGANFWAAPILASEGRGGDRARLLRELDRLQAMGVNNLRILAGGQSRSRRECLMQPELLTAPGEYNDTLLAGLDFVMQELERRGMTAVLYLNNSWEWSGGYTSFTEWAGDDPAPLPAIDGYNEYCAHAARFLRNDSAQAIFARHVERMVPRYAQSPALMAWQICNEPRPFGRDRYQNELMAGWLLRTARLIKHLDPHHMVSTGSEGSVGCEMDLDTWTLIHSAPEIDYATIHIWPSNWGWVTHDQATDSVDRAISFTDRYIAEHAAAMAPLHKPLVLEEFGYPRDHRATDPGTPTSARDRYYSHLVQGIDSGSLPLQGFNFWAWGGEGRPGLTYTGDPAHEPQGLYSVFAADSTTVTILTNHKP